MASIVTGPSDQIKWSKLIADDFTRREAEYRLSEGLQMMSRPYSFVRVKGIGYLLRYIARLSQADDQSELRVVIQLQHIDRFFVAKHLLQCVQSLQNDLESTAPGDAEAVEEHAVKEAKAIVELYQAMSLHCARTREWFTQDDNLKSTILLLQQPDNGLRMAVLEWLQCLLAQAPEKLRPIFEASLALHAVAKLLKQRQTPEVLAHACVETLYVYLAPDMPRALDTGDSRYAEWQVERTRRRRVLEAVVGENFVRQLLDSAGISTVKQQSLVSPASSSQSIQEEMARRSGE